MESPTFSEEGFPYQPPPSLWQLVENYVPVHELGVIKEMLGESLVEQSLELHEEVSTLLSIWHDYRDETEQLLTKHRLPEPPAIRELLKEEIKFFVASIKDKAKEDGRDDSALLSKHKTDVIDYALNSTRAPSSGYDSRPSTAQSSRDGRDTPLRAVPETPRSEQFLCSVTDEVRAVKDKLTYLQFDQVVQHLKETLEEEVETLTNDIEFLQNCLDDEADFRSTGGTSREPTLADLREERKALETELLAPAPKPHPLDRPTFTPSPPSSRPSSGTSIVSRNSTAAPFKKQPLLPKPVKGPASHVDPRLVQSTAPHDHQRSGPFKASHKFHITNIEHNLKTKAPPSSVLEHRDQNSIRLGALNTRTLQQTGLRDKVASNSTNSASGDKNTRPASPAAQRFRRMIQENRA